MSIKSSAPLRPLRPRSHRIALEARQLFDGAAFVEAASHAAERNAEHSAEASAKGAERTPAPNGPAQQDEVQKTAPHQRVRPDAPAGAQTDAQRPAESHAAAAGAPAQADAAAASAPSADGMPAPAIEVYVIDKSVAQWETLAAQLPNGSQIILIDSDRSGTAQIAQALAGETNISALHILSHGTADGIVLGNQTLSAEGLASVQQDLARIGASLTNDGDILLYGCDVAQGGTAFIDRLAALTRADVAASTDATGASALGGDWTLEAHSGTVEATALSLAAYDHLLAAPTVGTTATQLQVSEPSVLNDAGASSALLTGWTVSDDGSGNVTVDAIVTRPTTGALAGQVIGSLSSGNMSGVVAITDGLRFTGTAAQAQVWLNQLQFTAADNEAGRTVISGTVQVTVTDSEVPALSATHSLAVNILASNDPAIVNVAPVQAVAEVDSGSGTVISAATLGLLDPELAAGNQTASQMVYSLTTDPRYGYLTVNGVRLGEGSVFTQADLVAGNVKYHHTATGPNQNAQDSFSVRVNDGATPIDQSATSTVSLVVTPLNQAPTVSGGGSVLEGQPANSAGAAVGDFIVATGGGDPGDAVLDVRLTSLPEDGTLYFTGTLTIGGVSQTVSQHAITQADLVAGVSFAYAARGGLSYANDGQRDNDGSGSYPFTTRFGVVVTDGGGGAGSAAALSTSADITISIRAANDDPVFNAGSTLQDTLNATGAVNGIPDAVGYRVSTLTPAMIGATDVDSSNERLSFQITATSTTHGVLLLNGQILPAGSSFTMADVIAGRVQYVQTASAAPGTSDTFQFQVIDNTVGPRWNADGSLVQRIGGEYSDSGTPGDLGDDQLVTRTFTFHLATLAPGSGGTFTPLVPQPSHEDSNFAGNNGVQGFGQLNEGGSVVLVGTGRSATEPGLSYVVPGIDAGQVIYTIEAYDAGGGSRNGTLQLLQNGAWISLDTYDTFTQADLDEGRIRFVHDGGEDFESTVRFSVSAGVMTLSDPADPTSPLVPDQWRPTFSFFITPVNDAPTAVGSSDNVMREGQTIYIDATMLRIGDADDATSEPRLEGAAQGGTAGTTLPQGGSNYAYNNDASGANSLAFVVDSLPIGGTLQYLVAGTWTNAQIGSRIDSVLLSGNGVRFVSDGSEVRSTDFTVHAVDRWNAISGTAQIHIDITNVNDAPEIDRTPLVSDGNAGTVNSPVTVVEGGRVQITNANLNALDADNGPALVQYTITGAPAKGQVAYSTDGITFQVLGVGSSFTQQDVNNGRIYYLNRGGESDGHTFPTQTPTDLFSFAISDGDKEQRGNQFWVYVDPANDAPAVNAPSGPIDVGSADGTSNRVPGFSVADPDLTDAVTSGEQDFLQVTVRLLAANGTPLSAADYATLGVSIGYAAASGAAIDADKNGVSDYLTLRGTRAQINTALAGLTVAFASDQDATYQVQVIADDRLRDNNPANAIADGTLIGGANGGPGNQGATVGDASLPIDGSEPSWYGDSSNAAVGRVPTGTDALAANIRAASVTINASSVNDVPVLTTPANLSLYEDERTYIGAAFTVGDAESVAFGRNIALTLSVPSGHGTLDVAGIGAQTTYSINGRTVLISGDGTNQLVLTGRADDIQALIASGAATGLAFTTAANSNHDRNSTAAGDVTLTASLSDAGAAVGDATGDGRGNEANAPVVRTVPITVVPVNDAPDVTLASGSSRTTPIIVGGDALVSVTGFLIRDTDNTDGGALATTTGETDYMRVTVRITDATGAPLQQAQYDGTNGSVRITSSAAGTAGATVVAGLDGNGRALVIQGTLAQVQAYITGLQVSIGGALANVNTAYRVEVIADDRLRDAGGATGANGGNNAASGGGVQLPPTTDVNPYAAIPAGLTGNVDSDYRTLFASEYNDPANITIVNPTRNESAATIGFSGITVTDSDVLSGQMTATATVPPGFRITAVTGSGGTVAIAADGLSVTITGTLAQINTRLNAITVQLPDPAGDARPQDWNGSFSVTITVNDGGNSGGRPLSLTGDSNDPGTNPGDYAYAGASGAALLTTRTFVIAINPVNDAPRINDVTPISFGSTNEQTTSVAGTVASLFQSRFDDSYDTVAGGSNADTFRGIAIIGNASIATQGVWQYSLNGTTWLNVGTRSAGSALVLDASAQLRFVAANDFHGTPGSLTVRLVENNTNGDTTSTTTVPASGGTANLSSTSSYGGTSRYSAETVALSISVINVNDRPTGSQASLPAGTEDLPSPGATVGTLFGTGYSDARDNQTAIAGGANAATPLGGIAVVGNTANAATQGVWQYSLDAGATWSAVGAVSDASARLLPTDAQLRFVPVANFNGVPPDLAVRLSDAVVSAGAGINLGANVDAATSQWSTAQNLHAQVNPTNDVPVLSGTGGARAVTENAGFGTGSSTTLLLSGVTVSDIDLGTTAGLNATVFGAGTITVTLTGGFVGSGDVLSLAGTPAGVSGTPAQTTDANGNATLTIQLTQGATLAQVQALLESIQFRNTSDNPTNFGANGTRGFSVVVNDGRNVQAGGNAGAGTALSSNALTGTLTINAVNDPPEARDDSRNVTEDGGAISGNVITAGASGEQADTDRDSTTLTISAVRTGTESGSGTTGAPNSDLVGQYGTLHLNTDGSYSYTLNNADPRVQALVNGETLSDAFTYTVSDGALTDQAQLTITIRGANDAPTLTVVDGNATATGQISVSERGLNDALDASESASNSLSVAAPDGIASVNVGGTSITLAQLQAATPASPLSVTTSQGVILITGFTADATTTGPTGATLVTAGTISYGYTLTQAQDHIGNAEHTDVVALSVTGRGGNATSGNLTVLILDDTPQATADTASIIEDSATVGGNVFANDRIGGDGAATAGPVTGYAVGANSTSTPGTAVQGTFGSIAINADGSYTYALDNGNPRVQALVNGEVLIETVTYTITDHDGDTSSTTLTVTIRGANDTPTLTAVDGNAAATGQLTVSERGLNDALDASESANGTLNISAADGIASINVGGMSITLAQLQAATPASPLALTTSQGVISITGFTAGASTTDPTGAALVTAGTISYGYTLNTAQDHAGNTERTDVVALSVTGRGGDITNGNLTVLILDDSPQAAADITDITEDSVSVDGNVFANDRIGGDGAATAGPVSTYAIGANSTTTMGAAVQGNYGSIAINADGSFTYTLDNSNPAVNALKNGSTLTETVNYTITDHDGDTATTSLTITIRGRTDGTPTVGAVDGNGIGTIGEATVREAGLVDGTASETTTGELTLSALDGLAGATIGGTPLTLAQLQALGQGGAGNTVSIDTGEGTLVLTGFAPAQGTPGIVTGGTLEYTYTLKAPVVNAAGAADSIDTIALSVLDAGGASASGTLTVQIVDDAPRAQADSASIAEDAAVSTISGSVRSNDYQGADVVDASTGVPVTGIEFGGTPHSVGVAFNTQFGQLTINADGSYTYALDNGNAAVNALRNGDVLVEAVSYTLTDRDGDTSTATLRITIHGNTDGAPVIAPVDGNGAALGQATVFERGLVDGSGSQGATGQISVSAPDGLASVTIGTTLVPLADLVGLPGGTPIVIQTPAGTLQITGFTPEFTQGVITRGRLDYAYVLTQTQTHAPGATEAGDTIALRVTQADAQATTSTGMLTVRIVDDVPEARDDAVRITEDGAPSVSGNVRANDTLGADVANGVPVTAVSFQGQTIAAGATLQTQYGSIVINADGSYTYTLNNSLPAVQRLVPGETLVDTVRYTLIDNDGDTSTAQLTITIDGTTDILGLNIVDGNGAATGQLTVDERGLNNPANNSETTTGVMVIDAPDGIDRIVIAGSAVPIAQLLDLGNTPVAIATGKGTLTLTGFDPASGVLSFAYTLDRAQSHAVGAAEDVLAVTVFDRDGDSVTSNLVVDILDDAPQANNDRASVATANPDPTTVSGNVFGEAGAGFGDVADRLGADFTATPVSGVSVDGRVGTIGVPLQGLYGQLQLNADGSYSYAVDTRNARVVSLGSNQTLTETFTYTVTDADGDTSSATLTIVLRGQDGSIPKGDQFFWQRAGTSLPRLTQSFEPAVFVQTAVRDSVQIFQALAGRVSDGLGLAFGAEIEGGGLGILQSGNNLQYVSREGVGFSQQLQSDSVGRARGMGNSLVPGAQTLFDDFSPFGLNATFGPPLETGAAGAAGATVEAAAASDAVVSTPAERTAAVGPDATQAVVDQPSEHATEQPAVVGARGPLGTPQAARSFSEQLAVMAALQGSARDMGLAATAAPAVKITNAALRP